MDFNPIILSVPLFFLLIGIELLINHWQKAGVYRLNDAITNINTGTSQQTISVLFKVLIPLTLYELVYHNFAIWSIPNTWWSFILLFFAYDLCYYWAHRMSHEINLFWAGHVVHHQSEEYNLSVALRQSWFQSIFTAPFYLPLALAGFDTYLLIWVGAINLTYQFWIHTELIDKMGWFEWFMNTPSHHRVHHGRNPKYIDKNHAGVFIIWDRMFGTFQAEEERPTYGITTPLNSWNPVWANFSHFQTIYNQIRQTSGITNQLRVLLYKPGWRPKQQGGPIPIPDVSRKTYQKFDTNLPQSLARYALFQYFIITGLALFYFLSESDWTMTIRILGGIVIIWGVFQNSALFTPKPLVFWLDTLWLASALIFVNSQLSSSPVLWGFNIAALGLYLLVFVWRYTLRGVFFDQPQTAQKA